MSKRKRSQKRANSRSKSKTMRNTQRGGNYPASAWGSVMGTVGTGWDQFINLLTLQPGQNINANQSNNLVPINNANTRLAKMPAQSGGKRRKSRGKRGGNLLAIAEVAAVPATLIAMNHTLGRRSRRNRRR